MTWEYIAGFFDGEGSICHNGKGYRVTIVQTNQEVLDDIIHFSGVGSVIKITKRKAHWKDSWVYYIARQKDVYFFIKHVVRFLRVKKNVVEKVVPILSIYLVNKHRHELHAEKMKSIAKKMRIEGYTYREIGKKVGLDWGYVRRILIKQGIY
jgi:hypothetical protein